MNIKKFKDRKRHHEIKERDKRKDHHRKEKRAAKEDSYSGIGPDLSRFKL